jgi:hypothetical protein
MLDTKTRILNLSYRNTAISPQYSPGFSIRRSQRASSIGRVICRRLPAPLAGALVLPNKRRLVAMFQIVRSLQPATSAICACVKDLSSIMSRIRSCCDRARFGAIAEEPSADKRPPGQVSEAQLVLIKER